MVDETDRIRGLFIGTGGTTKTTMWYALSTPGPRWSAILDRLRSVDSAGSAAREGPLVAGRVRAIPVHGGIGYMQPRYRWRPATVPPALFRVALLDDTARSLAPIADGPAQPPELPTTPADFRASINALYTQMREAMKRGDWVAFGRAFDALGKALGRPVPQ